MDNLKEKLKAETIARLYNEIEMIKGELRKHDNTKKDKEIFKNRIEVREKAIGELE